MPNKKNKKIVGYTQGTFDTLHYGHVRLLKRAKEKCDYLIVGVNSDDLVKQYKNTDTIIKQNERLEIVSALRYVDEAHIVDDLDKISKQKLYNFDVCFIGSDWKGSDRYKKTEDELKKIGVRMIYLPYTKKISTTLIKEHRNKNNAD